MMSEKEIQKSLVPLVNDFFTATVKDDILTLTLLKENKKYMLPILPMMTWGHLLFSLKEKEITK